MYFVKVKCEFLYRYINYKSSFLLIRRYDLVLDKQQYRELEIKNDGDEFMG